MFLITPDDGSILPFKLGRQIAVGNEELPDPGQIVGPTDGQRVFVYQDRIETRVHRVAFLGLDDDEFLALEEYVRNRIKGAVQPFTLTYGKNRNLVSDSERYTPPASSDPQWVTTGTNPPTVTEKVVTGPEGYLASADRVAFGATQSVLRQQGVLAGLSNSGTVYISGLAKVDDAGGTAVVDVNSDGAATFNATILDDGDWHSFRGSYTGWLQTWVDFEILSRTLAFARIQVTYDSGFEEFEYKPLRTFTGCRLIPGRTKAREIRDGCWDVELVIRQEV